MRARSSRRFMLTMSLLLALSPGVAAQSLRHGTIGQEGAQVPAPGVPELLLGSRFLQLQTPSGIPTLGMRVGAWSGGSLGLSYSNSGAYLGNPHEIEFSVKQRLWSQERGAPLSASILGDVNTGAYSLDGELALSREIGPLTLLSTARLLGNADGARLPLGGVGAGARLAVLPQLALVGDVFKVVNDTSALPAWGAGVQLQVPASPYALTLHLSNTPSSTRQGASLGTSDLRFGIDMGMVFGGGPSSRAVAVAPKVTPPVSTPEKPSAQKPDPEERYAPLAPLRAAEASERPAPVPSANPEPEAPSKPRAIARPLPKPTPRPAAKPVSKAAAQAPAKTPVKSTAKPKPKTKPKTPEGGGASKGPHESELWIVMIRDGRPAPAHVRLTRGSSVTWFNRDTTPHALALPGWESGKLEPGTQLTRRFDAAGIYRYECRLHPGEVGVVTVR